MRALTLLSVLIFTPEAPMPERVEIKPYLHRDDCHRAASYLHALTNKSAFRREMFVCKEVRS